MLPPLSMPRPPMSKFSSRMITEEPVSLAAHAHARPETPAPTTTTSAERSHLVLAASASSGCSPTPATAMPAVPFATVVSRNFLRLMGLDPCPSLPMAFSFTKWGSAPTPVALRPNPQLGHSRVPTGRSRLFGENDPLCRLWDEILISRWEPVELQNERQDIHVRLVAQGVLAPKRHCVAYLLEAFLQSFSVP